MKAKQKFLFVNSKCPDQWLLELSVEVVAGFWTSKIMSKQNCLLNSRFGFHIQNPFLRIDIFLTPCKDILQICCICLTPCVALMISLDHIFSIHLMLLMSVIMTSICCHLWLAICFVLKTFYTPCVIFLLSHGDPP